jgi:hypothetical protein
MIKENEKEEEVNSLNMTIKGCLHFYLIPCLSFSFFFFSL